MDKLLGTFAKTYINNFSDKELADLEKLLNIDDTNLYNFYNNLNTDIEIENNNVTTLFKKFKYIVK